MEACVMFFRKKKTEEKLKTRQKKQVTVVDLVIKNFKKVRGDIFSVEEKEGWLEHEIVIQYHCPNGDGTSSYWELRFFAEENKLFGWLADTEAEETVVVYARGHYIKEWKRKVQGTDNLFSSDLRDLIDRAISSYELESILKDIADMCVRNGYLPEWRREERWWILDCASPRLTFYRTYRVWVNPLYHKLFHELYPSQEVRDVERGVSSGNPFMDDFQRTSGSMCCRDARGVITISCK